MMTPEMLRVVREEVRRQVNIILSGESSNSKVMSEDIQNLYPGMPGIPGRPVLHPYGYASRAPKGTISVTARQGDHPGNRVVLGHRAADRPTDLNAGESAVYSFGGYEMRFQNDSIMLGKDGTWQTAVLGEALTGILQAIVSQYNSHFHTGNLGAPTTPPTTPMQVTDLESNKHLCKDGGQF